MTPRGAPRRDYDADERHQARERALHVLYEAEMKGVAPSELLGAMAVPPDPMVAAILTRVEAERGEVDALIGASSRGWEVERMPVVDRNVMRIAVAELRGAPEVPTAVILDEAVELATTYSTEDSGRFVNGVLAAIARTVRPVGSGGEETPG